MAKCPNCDVRIPWNALECPRCAASFEAGAAWHPIPESPEEAQQLKTSFPVNDTVPSTGRIALANVSLGMAFGVSALFAPGGRVLKLLFDLPLLQSLGPVNAHLLNVFANYWLPAVLIYLLLRASHIDSRLKLRVQPLIMIGVANTLLLLYIAVRIFASSIEGGGPSFVVASYAPLVVFPSWLLLAGGLVWIALASVKGRRNAVPWRSFTVWESFAIVVFLIPPALFSWHLAFTKDGPIYLAREARTFFEQKCKLAGEQLIKKVSEEVQGLYFEPDGASYYQGIRNGVYSGSGGGILGEPLVNSGWLLYFERKNQRPRRGAETFPSYTRHYLKDWKGQAVDELRSRFGVYAKDLVSADEKKLGVDGMEISIVDLTTKETIATTTYFVSTRHRRFCGHAPDGSFNVSSFVRRTLNLKRQFSTVFPVESRPPNE